ncbi:Putative uncharacterized protein [Escherichia coli D6-117.29]|nr:Putative uncharacterized protein [Escherichia coli D6-117.29]
MPFTYAVL